MLEQTGIMSNAHEYGRRAVEFNEFVHRVLSHRRVFVLRLLALGDSVEWSCSSFVVVPRIRAGDNRMIIGEQTARTRDGEVWRI